MGAGNRDGLPDPDILSAMIGIAYTWDANGNLLDDGENTYAYDAAN